MAFASLWDLDPSVTYLNHGSFGACPKAVLEAQASLRRELEHNAIRFYMREYEDRIDHARFELARFVGADPAGLAFVRNASEGVNTVVQRLELEPGDAILTTNHAYPSCRAAIDFVAERSGARVVVAKVPFPIRDKSEVTQAIMQAATPRTKLALLDHVTSPTGLVFPLEEIVPALEAHGVPCLVDGAHAPGMIPLEIDRLAPSWYVGNCHKWLCAPKGVGFLWARADRRASLRPLVISAGAPRMKDRSRFRLEFDWPGTFDPTAALCVPISIAELAKAVPGGWDEVRRRNHELVLEGRRTILDAIGGAPAAPEDMIGSLAAIPIADRTKDELAAPIDPLVERLYRDKKIEVPIFAWPSREKRVLRISAQLYNSPRDYRFLIEELTESGTSSVRDPSGASSG
jgi:isopenicillin-N epimerase